MEATMTATEKRIVNLETAVRLLREHAEFLNEHDFDRAYDERPHVAWSERSYVSASYGYGGLTFDVQGPDSLQLATALRRRIGGRWEKRATDYSFSIFRKVDGLRVEIQSSRDAVCTKRVVGTEEVTIPAVEAKPERVETRDVIEWDCTILLSD